MTMLQYDKGHPIINNKYYNKKCASAYNYSGSARGVVVYQYTRKKIRQNTQNSSKYTQNNQSMNGRYTLYLKFKDSDIPNTRI